MGKFIAKFTNRKDFCDFLANSYYGSEHQTWQEWWDEISSLLEKADKEPLKWASVTVSFKHTTLYKYRIERIDEELIYSII